MDKHENRLELIKNLVTIANFVEITPELMACLEGHQIFGTYVSINKGLTDDQMKMFILLELTRTRRSCNQVIKILDQCHQSVAGLLLSFFNRSSGPMKLINEVELMVKKAPIAHQSQSSNIYRMCRNPRGKCVIINFVEEPQLPKFFDDFGREREPMGLKNQTNQFAHVFTQLHFDVFTINDRNAQQLVKFLMDLRSKGLEKSDAFVLIIISHGQNEEIFCNDGCRVIRDINFGLKSGKEWDSFKKLAKDRVSISEITGIFSEKNCPALYRIPKLFFFVCCRVPPDPNHDNSFDRRVIARDLDLDTFLSYSCAKGFPTYYDPFTGFSYYGQALCHSLAQYACDESLDAIMSRTTQRLENMFNEQIIANKDWMEESFATEVTKPNGMRNQLFFNPGYD